MVFSAAGIILGARYRRTDWVVLRETEVEAICLVQIEWIRIQNLDVHLPYLEVVRLDELDAWW